jgi:hypothetical protein
MTIRTGSIDANVASPSVRRAEAERAFATSRPKLSLVEHNAPAAEVRASCPQPDFLSLAVTPMEALRGRSSQTAPKEIRINSNSKCGPLRRPQIFLRMTATECVSVRQFQDPGCGEHDRRTPYDFDALAK